MPSRHALVIAIDGLRASALGAYGNTWHDTPAIDALAAQSCVHDWMWSTSTKLEDFYRAVWQGEHALLRSLAEQGVNAALTTDDATVADAPFADFTEVCCLDFAAAELAPTIADTAMAQLFALAAQQFLAAGNAAAQRPKAASRLWWLHSRGFHGPWDAPLNLRERLLDEEDPAAPAFMAPPSSTSVADHDALLLCRVAYAAQAMVLDQCVGALMTALAESGLDQDMLVVLVGCRGYALGEHGAVGASGLYSENLHVPCLVRLPDMASPPPRSAELVQTMDVAATLASWFGLAPPDTVTGFDLLAHAASPREFVTAVDADGERAIRTAAWMLRQPPQHELSTAPSIAELYAKPDDRWEANDVASRCPDVAARLLSVLDGLHSATGNASAGPPMDRDLVIPAR
jgi:arylsulfatase A-like enzyme